MRPTRPRLLPELLVSVVDAGALNLFVDRGVGRGYGSVVMSVIEAPVRPIVVGSGRATRAQFADVAIATARRGVQRSLRSILSEGGAVGFACGLLYLTCGAILALHFDSLPGDAVSRMANGFYVLYSGDPHLAAIGFVWTPLTSICDIFFLLFKGFWGALATNNMAGCLTTVCAGVGAVHQVRCALKEFGIPRAPRLVLTAGFALNPMIVFFSANGMSEALYVFMLVAATRYLLRWVADNDTRSLVFAASFLGLGYLARNETIAAAAGATVLVFAITAWRSAGTRSERLAAALTDAVIIALPFVVCFSGWAITSWIITGHPFQQYGGNAVLVQASGFKPGPIKARLLHELKGYAYLAPLGAAAALAAFAVALRRRDPRVLVPIAIVGGGLAFSFASYMKGILFPWYRYDIMVIPLDVLLLGFALSRPLRSGANLRHPRQAPAPRALGRHAGLAAAFATVVALVILVPSLPSSAIGMLDPVIGAGETGDQLGFIFHHTLNANDKINKVHHAVAAARTRYIESLHLPPNSVLVDNQVECVADMIVTISDPTIFVIPNDRYFERDLSDPETFHVRYLLVSAGAAPDFVSAGYPGLFATGSGFAKKVHVFPAEGGCQVVRLYRVTGHPPPGSNV